MIAQDFSHEVAQLLPYAVNSAIVLVILVLVCRKPLRKYLYQRHEHMKDAFESATIAHAKAQSRAEEARKMVAGLGQEQSALSKSEKESAEGEKKEILSKAQAEAARVASEAERLAGFEAEDASEKVKAQFLNLVIAQTEDSLRKNLKKEDHSAILKRVQASIEVGV